MSDDFAIKSGPEVVQGFLDSLNAGDSIDPLTLACIRELHKSGRLTRTRLLQSLERARSQDETDASTGGRRE
jgi:hypothetical protein